MRQADTRGTRPPASLVTVIGSPACTVGSLLSELAEDFLNFGRSVTVICRTMSIFGPVMTGTRISFITGPQILMSNPCNSHAERAAG
ncbi:hypothetical protein SAMN04488011_106276 [Palleronia pelagia]|uniref:Uncharacterized protein n=1 Tax=Palleronia pelagia TaxID=387096 RepID=A0A1H8JNT5_9RHOB|nr:hypothetical protein SAMN04488011_106276 [Palleronia pelagia]